MSYATSSSLRMDWIRRASDKDFILQMATMNDNGHGFLPCFTGMETRYECTNLPRATGFWFRLRATNDFGQSAWSPEVYYCTLPDPPGQPPKPQVKGKIHSSQFKIKWEPPSDTGGASITLYYLQISSGGTYEQVYVGKETETICDRLSPATTYQVRVSCEGVAGRSTFSEPCTVTTEPVTPGAPSAPQLYAPGVYSAGIRWGPPLDNGGAPVLEYELELDGTLSSSSSSGKVIVYRGKELNCDLKQLLPGQRYTVQVRAYNRIGAGAWSEVYEFHANAAPPNAPKAPEIVIRSPTIVTAQWLEPATNGAPIQEYQLAWSTTDQSPDAFQVAYRGLSQSHDLTTLQPFRRYYAKVCAVNGAGTSPYSDIVEVNTPAGPPCAPLIHELQVRAQDVTLFWREPECHGSPIVSYCVEYSAAAKGSASSNSSSPQMSKKVALQNLTRDADNQFEYTLEQLSAETNYRIKMRAVNEVGSSPLSSASKVTTLPLPPTPPQLECVAVAHNSLKLKWGEGRNVNFLYYYVDMSHSRSREYANVYSGPNFTCKVTKLAELTAYKFRIRAKADRAGMGAYSEDVIFRTSAAQPQSIKAPRIYYPQDPMATGSTGTNASNAAEDDNNNRLSINVEWQHSKNSFHDPVEYILQLKRADSQDFQQVRGGAGLVAAVAAANRITLSIDRQQHVNL